jgi:hypothetical protein
MTSEAHKLARSVIAKGGLSIWGYDNASTDALLDALREGVCLLTVDRERLEREFAEGETENKRYSWQR